MFPAIFLGMQSENAISAPRTAPRGWCKIKTLVAIRRRAFMGDQFVLGGARSGKPRRGSGNKAAFLEAVDEGHPQHILRDALTDRRGAPAPV